MAKSHEKCSGMLTYQTAGVSNDCFHYAHNLSLGVHQGSVLGPFYFKMIRQWYAASLCALSKP